MNPTHTNASSNPGANDFIRYAKAVLWRVIGDSYNEDQIDILIQNNEAKWKAKKRPAWETGYLILELHKPFSLRFKDCAYRNVVYKRTQHKLRAYFSGSHQLVTSREAHPISKGYADTAVQTCPWTQPPPPKPQHKTPQLRQLRMWEQIFGS